MTPVPSPAEVKASVQHLTEMLPALNVLDKARLEILLTVHARDQVLLERARRVLRSRGTATDVALADEIAAALESEG